MGLQAAAGPGSSGRLPAAAAGGCGSPAASLLHVPLLSVACVGNKQLLARTLTLFPRLRRPGSKLPGDSPLGTPQLLCGPIKALSTLGVLTLTKTLETPKMDGAEVSQRSSEKVQRT